MDFARWKFKPKSASSILQALSCWFVGCNLPVFVFLSVEDLFFLVSSKPPPEQLKVATHQWTKEAVSHHQFMVLLLTVRHSLRARTVHIRMRGTRTRPLPACLLRLPPAAPSRRNLSPAALLCNLLREGAWDVRARRSCASHADRPCREPCLPSTLPAAATCCCHMLHLLPLFALQKQGRRFLRFGGHPLSN